MGNQEDVESALNAIRDVKRRTRKPIELKRRDEGSGPENTPNQQAPLSVEPPPLPPPQLPDTTPAPNSVQPSSPDVPSSPPQDRPPQ